MEEAYRFLTETGYRDLFILAKEVCLAKIFHCLTTSRQATASSRRLKQMRAVHLTARVTDSMQKCHRFFYTCGISFMVITHFHTFTGSPRSNPFERLRSFPIRGRLDYLRLNRLGLLFDDLRWHLLKLLFHFLDKVRRLSTII